jgi:hypothetical protein
MSTLKVTGAAGARAGRSAVQQMTQSSGRRTLFRLSVRGRAQGPDP